MLRLKTYSILISALLMSTIHAASSFPKGCEVTGFSYNQNEWIVNETGKQAYYLIQNKSDNKIEIEHPSVEDDFISPPMHASFDPMTWGAFASDVPQFHFKCYKTMNDSTSIIDCRDVLEVCQYPRVRFALSNMGNYWIAFNKTKNAVIEESVAKGIYLKW